METRLLPAQALKTVWIGQHLTPLFGQGDVTTGHLVLLRPGDPVEQEKRIKDRDVVANAIMVHNVVERTNVLVALQQEGVCVTPEAASRLSPYLNGPLKRFGQYVLDMAIHPEPLELKTLFGTRA